MVVPTVSEERRDSPQPVATACLNSSRSAWFSMVAGSASVSATTVPSASMMVRRFSGAAWLNCSVRLSGSVMALWASMIISSS